MATKQTDKTPMAPHDPDRLQAFLRGHLTLGELQGIGKEAQYQIAKMGYDFLRQGKTEQALRVFMGLVALDPYDAYFLTAVGVLRHEAGEHAQADAFYTRALEVNPFSVVALTGRGEVRLALGRVDEAVADLARAVEVDPEGKEPPSRRARALVTVVRAQLLASKSDPAKAAQEAKLAIEDLKRSAAPSIEVDAPAAPTTEAHTLIARASFARRSQRPQRPKRDPSEPNRVLMNAVVGNPIVKR